MKYLLLLILISCSSYIEENNLSNQKYNRIRLENSLNYVTNDRIDTYLKYLSNRLSYAISRKYKNTNFIIKLYEDSTPQAYALDKNTIIISTGLIKKLNVEAEIAFVCAHEMAHLTLKHDKIDHNLTLISKNKSRIEKSADIFANGLIALAGYNPHYSVSAIKNAYRGIDNKNSSYPMLKERIQYLKNDITNSGWRPPGTIDRREYQKVRDIVKNFY